LEQFLSTEIINIDAKNLHYKALNQLIRRHARDGVKHISLENVNGQRYIGTGITTQIVIDINGVPGSDLGAFMDGPTINVFANAQDAVGNTMNNGRIVIHGNGGDVVGFAMRGGKLFVKGDVGYRVGIHMKQYEEKMPILVVGGIAKGFLGEYMAGGVLIVLGLSKKEKEPLPGSYIGTGMHGGAIYLRGSISKHQLGKEVVPLELDEQDMIILEKHLTDFANEFNFSVDELLHSQPFTKLLPLTHRPYGRLYAY
jgi:glutamate synthase domain-containing protein 3